MEKLLIEKISPIEFIQYSHLSIHYVYSNWFLGFPHLLNAGVLR